MNVYLVRTKDERLWHEIIDIEIGGPHEPYWPCSIIVAETRGKAKSAFLSENTQSICSGVYTDDYPNLRTQTLETNTDLPAGNYDHGPHSDRFWLMVKPWRESVAAVPSGGKEDET